MPMSSALAFRRFALIVAPLIAALLIIAGFFFDPAIEKSGREMAKEYAAHPGRSSCRPSLFTSPTPCSPYQRWR